MRKKLRGNGASNLEQGEESDSAVTFGNWGCLFWGATAGLTVMSNVCNGLENMICNFYAQYGSAVEISTPLLY